MTAPVTPGETPNPFMTAPVTPGEAPNPFMSAPGAAGEAPNPFMATPAAPCENPNPFMPASSAACDSSNPFVPAPVAGNGPAATSGSSGTAPFGVAYADAVTAAPARLEAADRIVVKKSERRLYLLHSDRVLREYPIRLGLNPYGPKQREGDFRTPEGVYRLSRRNTNSDFFLSVEVSYPNEADRERARSSGVSPGGLIMIHGQPNVPRKSSDYYASNDWTDGCIAVSNSDMVDIWMRTSIGTPIEIRP
jgi:lipoprotein-anchoring transpeptidase ErfK/SrfK